MYPIFNVRVPQTSTIIRKPTPDKADFIQAGKASYINLQRERKRAASPADRYNRSFLGKTPSIFDPDMKEHMQQHKQRFQAKVEEN